MIHAAADDMKTDPSGNAGDRIVRRYRQVVRLVR
jgi:hypothetical protein